MTIAAKPSDDGGSSGVSSLEENLVNRLCLISLPCNEMNEAAASEVFKPFLDDFDVPEMKCHRLGELLSDDVSQTIRPAWRSVLVGRVLPELQSEYLFFMDESYELDPKWLRLALKQMQSGQADVVVSAVAARDLFGKVASTLVERLTKTNAAAAPAVLVRKSAVVERTATIRPAGRWLALEMQLRVPEERRQMLASPVPMRKFKPGDARLGQTEVGFLKSFIDHKYGNASRLIQFCAVGFSGMIVDLTLYAFFQRIFCDSALSGWKVPLIGGGGDLALAGFLAVWLAMTWNFLVNRRVTFNDARRNSSIVRQYLTYATGNALAIGVSLVIRLWLPTRVAFFNEHKLAAALVGIVLATGISFSMARYFVFKSPGRS